MGQVLIKTDIGQVNTLISEWCAENNFYMNPAICSREKHNTSEANVITATNLWHRITWEYYLSPKGILAKLQVRSRTYIDVIFCLVICLGLFYALYTFDLLLSFNIDTVLSSLLTSCILMAALWLWLFKLGHRLSCLNAGFWKTANQKYDCIQLTPGGNDISFVKMATMALCCCSLTYLITNFFGALGIIFFGIPVSIPIILYLYLKAHKRNPQSEWRVWIMTNMFTWVRLMMMILLIIAVPLFLEVFATHTSNKMSIDLPLRFKAEYFRKVTPAEAAALEQNCFDFFYALADKQFCLMFSTANSDIASFRKTWIENSISHKSKQVFYVLAVGIAYILSLPIIAILKRHKDWQNHIIDMDNRSKELSMPYLPQSWRWKQSLGMNILIWVSALFGAVINWAGIIVCIEGLSYLFFGQTFIYAQFANLWSWLAAIPKIAFGIKAGSIIATLLIFIINIPFLILLAIFLLRTLSFIILLFRMSSFPAQTLEKQEKYAFVKSYIMKICNENHLPSPVLVFTKDQQPRLYMQYIYFFNKTVLFISQRTLDLLTIEELQAAIAHEIGHIRQGQWKISWLKLLSSLALFPNYYLTFCIDWAKKEIDADKFAVEVTKNTEALKHALIKMSTFHMTCSMSAADQHNLRKLHFGLRQKMFNKYIMPAVASLKFYFSVALIGYIHPCLSERLQAIDQHSGEMSNVL